MNFVAAHLGSSWVAGVGTGVVALLQVHESVSLGDRVYNRLSRDRCAGASHPSANAGESPPPGVPEPELPRPEQPVPPVSVQDLPSTRRLIGMIALGADGVLIATLWLLACVAVTVVKASGSETILVVDDDEMVRKVAMLSLNQHGYHTMGAGDGHRGAVSSKLLTRSVVLRSSSRHTKTRLLAIQSPARTTSCS
jgi:hypothetical protein